jgi:hypothetical protein
MFVVIIILAVAVVVVVVVVVVGVVVTHREGVRGRVHTRLTWGVNDGGDTKSAAW